MRSAAVSSATLALSGVGYHRLHVNGQQVDPSRHLDPGWTTYQRRTYYISLDITKYLRQGDNAIGVTLGQGWYSRQQFIIGMGGIPDLAVNYGPSRFILQLNINLTDGSSLSVVSDSSWLGREAEYRSDSVYMGTITDLRAARADFSSPSFSDPSSLWIAASVLPSPLEAGGVLSLQPMDPVRVGESALHIATSASRTGHDGRIAGVQGGSLMSGGVLRPVATGSANGIVFDLGQNFAGWCRVSNLTLPRSFVVQMRHSEYLYSQGENGIPFSGIDTENLWAISATDTFVMNGTEGGNEVIEPAFTYHGFRYLLLTGVDGVDSSQVECYAAHSETTLIGNFTSSSSVLNQIQHNILWSQLSNSVSLPTDCPQRNERRGWMGDAGLSVDEALFNFDLVPFYLGFLQQINDTQLPDGTLSDTVPYTVGGRPADPNWSVLISHSAETASRSCQC